MQKTIRLFFLIAGIIIISIVVSCDKKNPVDTTPPPADKVNTVVEYFGKLQVQGNKVVDKNGNPVVLRGMSLFWSQWGGEYFNEKCITWLRDDWKCTIIRVPLGIEMAGYLEHKDEIEKVFPAIDACIKLGIYVIFDWHDHHAQDHLGEAKNVFKTIAQKYGDKPNIIYEIFNEPDVVSWPKVVKPYAKAVIDVIRQYDPDNLIIVGNPSWSQDVDVASKDPVADANVVYTLHFYAATHKQSLRDKATIALRNGAALFVSEYGPSEYTGSGVMNFSECNRWFDFMEKNHISNCNWTVWSESKESCAILKPNASVNGNWKDTDLSTSGKYIRNYLRTKNISIFDALEGE